MKKLVLFALVLLAMGFKAKAQEKFSETEFKKHVTKKATLCDTVASYKIFNDSLSMLNMGGKYPYQKFTIVVTGKEIVLNFDKIKGKHICVTGDLSTYKNKPEIMIYHTDQLVFK
jgi:hypothetical protein